MTEQPWPAEARAAVVEAIADCWEANGRSDYQCADAVLAALDAAGFVVVPRAQQSEEVSIVVPQVRALAPHETTAGRYLTAAKQIKDGSRGAWGSSMREALSTLLYRVAAAEAQRPKENPDA